MTQGAAGSVRAATWTEAHGVAAACVGLLLLAGTMPCRLLTGTGPGVSRGRERSRPDGPIAACRRGATAARDRAARGPRVHRGRREPAPTHRLDINRADAEALQALPGIGPTLARRIVAYREAHGPFRASGDLLRVPGIGAKRYARTPGTDPDRRRAHELPDQAATCSRAPWTSSCI